MDDGGIDVEAVPSQVAVEDDGIDTDNDESDSAGADSTNNEDESDSGGDAADLVQQLLAKLPKKRLRKMLSTIASASPSPKKTAHDRLRSSRRRKVSRVSNYKKFGTTGTTTV